MEHAGDPACSREEFTATPLPPMPAIGRPRRTGRLAPRRHHGHAAPRPRSPLGTRRCRGASRHSSRRVCAGRVQSATRAPERWKSQRLSRRGDRASCPPSPDAQQEPEEPSARTSGLRSRTCASPLQNPPKRAPPLAGPESGGRWFEGKNLRISPLPGVPRVRPCQKVSPKACIRETNVDYVIDNYPL